MVVYVLSSVSVLKSTEKSDHRLPRLATWHSKVAGLEHEFCVSSSSGSKGHRRQGVYGGLPKVMWKQ